ncbi:amidohydrolase family protein [Neoroseomonas rubea]|uniref:amidohydrolase family protein n=1 Tax=Neoroseomonas rubea TaxID=2748666 RepID=UPI0018DF8563|nr:amidohydrolase family protein [Roseomonas rubea]
MKLGALVDHHGHVAPQDALADAMARRFMPFPKDPPPLLFDVAGHHAQMDAQGILRRIVSVPPILYLYELPAAEQAARIARLNDWLAGLVAGTRLSAMAVLPLGDPAAALAELRRCAERHGIRDIAIGSHVAGTDLDKAVPDELWAALAEGGGLVMLHPWQVRDRARLDDRRLGNPLGNPFETAVAAARLIEAGTLQRHPSLRLMLAHGGGALPFLLGRMDRAWEAAEHGRAPERPSLAARRFLYDTVVFEPEPLAFLARMVGPERILFGTDSPFDMSLQDPAELLAAAGLAT